MAEVHSLAAYMQGRLSLKDFEWPQSLRPSLPSTTHLHSHLVPEIDLQALLAPERRECKSAELHGSHETVFEGSCAREYTRLIHAATTCGFFQVHNHCVPIHALETLYSYARRFFAMPLEHKLEVANKFGHIDMIAGKNNTGYMGGTPLDCPKKCWFEALRTYSLSKKDISAVACCLLSEEVDQQAFGDALEACSQGFEKLAAQLAQLLLRELIDVDADEVLRTCMTEIEQGVKLSHYPACPQPDKTLGLPAHTDASLLTVLWQDGVGGLQVHLDGQWINVKPRPNALVINIGDLLQVWSNDWYKSGMHQVVLNSTQSRYSIGYVYNPSGDTTLAPLPQVLKRTGQPPKFKSIQTSEYRRQAFAQALTAASTKDELQGVDILRCEEDNADLE